MRSPALLVTGAAAVLVIGYAFYTLVHREVARPQPEAVTASVEQDGKPSPRESGPRAVTPAGVKPAPVTRVGDARLPGGPPPRPEPKVSLEEARDAYDEFMAELDRVKAEGRVLDNAEWTEYYRRGHEVLLPLQQHLDWSVPAQADELRRANEDLRARLNEIQPFGPGAAPR